MSKTLNILDVGKSGRNDCIAAAVRQSLRPHKLFIMSDVINESLRSKAHGWRKGKTDSPDEVARYARDIDADLVIIGPEEPLAEGVVDRLLEMGIPTVGPTISLARLESSKSFTRELLTEFNIPGNPEHRVFRRMDGIEPYLRRLGDFVVKPDGLTSGKGVRVSGEHLKSIDQALAYCRELLEGNRSPIVIEEKLDGEEFSFQSFCDGYHVIDTFPVQDHKRAGEGDTGDNTGGMGSYSCEDHSLPFLRPEHIREASYINQRVCDALRDKCGEPYRGILYGGFMVTKYGLRLIEYNARFGDPEVMNVLPLLETDFLDVCKAIVSGTLDTLPISFARKATVCKYVVPQGYPSNPIRNVAINVEGVPKDGEKLRVYYAAVDDERTGSLQLTGSRAIAFVGIGETLAEAERIAEEAANLVRGPVVHRSDIGTDKLVRRRVDHMSTLLAEHTEAPPLHRAA